MITIVNLKTNLTGQVADHIGMDDKLLESQGYARIDVPQMPVYSEPSGTLPGISLLCERVKQAHEFEKDVEKAQEIQVKIDIEESTKALISKSADQMASINVKRTRKKRTTKNKNT